MLHRKLLNTDKESEVLFDICIPCWETSTKLDLTIASVIEGPNKVTLPCKFIINVAKQSVVANRLTCLTESKAPYVMWLDDDIQFREPGWDKILYDMIDEPEKIDKMKYGVIGVNVVHYKARTNVATRPHGFVSDVCGALMMTKKLPGVQFDSKYVGSQWEDTDYCYQVRKAGYGVYQNNNIWILHYNEEKNRDYTHNQAYFNSKWHTM